MTAKNASYQFTIRVTHDDNFIQILGYYPCLVRDEKLRASVSELINRANYGMVLGRLEMDMSDGEIRFHVSHLVEGITPSMETIERIFMTALFTMDRYFPAFMQHLHAGYTPEDAVYLAELDYHADRLLEDNRIARKTPPKKSSNDAKAPDGEKGSTPQNSNKSARKKRGDGETGLQPELPL